jgi:hypothetical protein
MATSFLKDKAKVCDYLGQRIRHLAKIFAHALDEGAEEAALRELIEIATVMQLLAMVVDREDSVRMVGDDYVIDVDTAQNEIPF